MDERAMIEWIENILKPYTKKLLHTACAGFLLVPHDDVGGGVYPTARCRSGTHP